MAPNPLQTSAVQFIKLQTRSQWHNEPLDSSRRIGQLFMAAIDTSSSAAQPQSHALSSQLWHHFKREINSIQQFLLFKFFLFVFVFVESYLKVQGILHVEMKHSGDSYCGRLLSMSLCSHWKADFIFSVWYEHQTVLFSSVTTIRLLVFLLPSCCALKN